MKTRCSTLPFSLRLPSPRHVASPPNSCLTVLSRWLPATIVLFFVTARAPVCAQEQQPRKQPPAAEDAAAPTAVVVVDTPSDIFIGADDFVIPQKDGQPLRLPVRFPFSISIQDAAPINPAGKTFTATLTPTMHAGLPQHHNIGKFEISSDHPLSPPLPPAANIGKRILGPKPKNTSKKETGDERGFLFNPVFPKTKTAALPAATITATTRFNIPVALTWFEVNGRRDGYPKIDSASLTIHMDDGDSHEHPLPVDYQGNFWKITWMDTSTRPVSHFVLRVTTKGKLEITNVEVLGRDMRKRRLANEWQDMNLRALWRDAGGRILTPPRPLTLGKPVTLESPPNPPPGYYGLLVEATKDNMIVYQKETGFGVVAPPCSLPAGPASRPVPPQDSFFGMVHLWLGIDPWIRPGWIKTTMVRSDTSPRGDKAWRETIALRRQNGFEELPILAERGVWGKKEDNNKPVEKQRLDQIRDLMRHRAAATPDLLHYELGLEENLSYRNHGHAWPDMWTNLAAKARAAREGVTAAVGAARSEKIRFGYQIAELDYRSMEEFIKSDAFAQFQFLALHPYVWDTFPMPDGPGKWLETVVTRCRGFMKEAGREIPIWITEIGAPHNANPGGFFGVPYRGILVNGLTRENLATYMTRVHVIAASLGIERVFWYNFRDKYEDPFYGERNFGVSDARGFPKPAYLTYLNMLALLDGLKSGAAVREGELHRYRFDAPDGSTTWVLWKPEPDGSPASFPIASLGKITRAFDNYGTPRDISTGLLEIGSSPVYLLTN
ncbi:hypothetical protein OpiT1DRAFT_02448 [Opitutaceae bacterium TAV1]|nr:hypothetical protein OpiT1DRAFT_02448 [Opitutaceae bacterium TAV1]